MAYFLGMIFLILNIQGHVLEALASEGDIKYVSLNERMRNSEKGQKTFNGPLIQMREEDIKNIAVIDSGYYQDHDQLKDRFTEGYDAVYQSHDIGIFSKGYVEMEGMPIDPAHTHGTHMASLIAQVLGDFPPARRIKIVPVKVGTDPLSDLNINIRALDYVAGRRDVGVVSISLNYPIIFHAEPDDLPAFKEALLRVVDSGKLIVLAALNDNKAYVKESLFAQFVLSPEVKGRIIVVGATKRFSSGEEIITTFSNKAGVLARQFMVGPGCHLRCATYTSVSNLLEKRQSTEMASGSSHATAGVAGGLIYLMNQFLGLDLDDFPKILFESAIKTIQHPLKLKRSLKIYGQGLVDLDNGRLMAATMLVHRRQKLYNGFTTSTTSLQKVEEKEGHSSSRESLSNKLKRPSSSQLSLSPHLISSWGRWGIAAHKDNGFYWISNKVIVKENGQANHKRKMIIRIPDEIRADHLFKPQILDKHASVFFDPTSKMKEDLSAQEKNFVKDEKDKGEVMCDGMALSYTIALNKEGKVAFVTRGKN